MLALVAQSDAPPTGDQEIVGLIPAGSGIDHEIFVTYPLLIFSQPDYLIQIVAIKFKY